MNLDKFREFEALFKATPEVELIPAESVLRNPQKLGFVENYSTYLENAAAKARLAHMGSHYPCLADDTGLEVAALGGKPGVHTARYATLSSNQKTRDAQDEANRALLLKELAGKTDRSAQFVTTLTLLIEGILVHATGVLEGSIAESERGDNGFGYDSIFIPKGSSRTLAEMTDSEKNAISHRGRALQELMTQIKARGMVFAKP